MDYALHGLVFPVLPKDIPYVAALGFYVSYIPHM